MSVTAERLAQSFFERFARRARLFSAPGRVNLIGEHTDYNDGFVLPLAVERRTYVAGAARPDGRVTARSLNASGEFEFELAALGAGRRGQWGDYVEGVAVALQRNGYALRGADLLIDSEVPAGAGLSASAALEIAVGYALCELAGGTVDRRRLALAGQAAEHSHVGTRCGIMDQYISALGQSQHALLIDCRSLEPKLVPLRLGSARLLVCDTRARHELATSEYNQRRAECERSVALLAEQLPGVTALRDVSLEQLASNASRLPEPLLRRARHVVSENERTLMAAAALERGELARVGELMFASHASLRDDYEVSCAELDLAVDTARSVAGVYGARMTGGGFGGCAIALVEAAAVSTLEAALRAAFAGRFGTEPGLFSTDAANGVCEHALP